MSLFWKRANALSKIASSEGDSAGEVEFTARYLAHDRLCALHETSSFERIAGLWLYTEGAAERAETRVERNATCPCGLTSALAVIRTDL